MGPPPRQLVTNALIATLRRELDRTSVKIHDHALRVEKPTYPHGNVYSLPGGSYSGPPLSAPEADASYVYQVTVVGTRRDQVEATVDRIDAIVIGREEDGSFSVAFETIDGYAICGRMSADTLPGGVEPQEGSTALYQATPRYIIALTPQGDTQ